MNERLVAELPRQFHPLAIRRGLVAGLTKDSRLFKLVAAIVRLCTELDSRVVAEGIETETELEAVIAAGARYVQGYLLARPAFPPPPITWPAGIAPLSIDEPRKKV